MNEGMNVPLRRSWGDYKIDQGPQNEVEGREKECKPGALPLLRSMGGVPRVSRVHYLLANLKHKSWN